MNAIFFKLFWYKVLSSENKITHFPGGFRLNQNETRFQLQRSWTKKFKYFVALPSPNTKKNHPKWDLGRDFCSQTFIERKKIKIRAFPKTSRKRCGANGLETTWRQCWSSGRKNVLRNRLRIPYCRLKAGFSVCRLRFLCVVLWEFWLRLNEIHEVRTFSPCKAFLFVFVVVVVF